MAAPYISPRYAQTAFNCPECGVHARQTFGLMAFEAHNLSDTVVGKTYPVRGLAVAVCSHCEGSTLWDTQTKTMILPLGGGAPFPNPDLPDDIMGDYEEARAIVGRSPRGAAALLRLAVQKLCKHLGQPGEHIDADIKALVAKGLPASLQQAFDSVRLIGNDSVHPGKIDLRDDADLATALFGLVNIIAENTISEPKRIEAIYQALPQSKRDAIARRDRTAPNPLP